MNFSIFLSLLCLLTLPFTSQAEDNFPLRLEVFYSVEHLSPRDPQTKGSDKTYRLSYYVYIRNISGSEISLASRAPTWIENLGGANPYLLNIELPITPSGEKADVSAIPYNLITLRPGRIVFLHKFVKFFYNEAPAVEGDVITYTVDKELGELLKVWIGSVSTNKAISLENAMGKK